MDTTEQKKRRKKHRKRTKKKERPVENGLFVWEYAFESLTERGSAFRRNYPEYD